MDRMYSWAMMPVIYRKDARDEYLMGISDKDDKFAERFAEIQATAELLEEVLKENYKLFFDLLPESAYDKDDLELTGGIRPIIILFYILLFSRVARTLLYFTLRNMPRKRLVNFLNALLTR